MLSANCRAMLLLLLATVLLAGCAGSQEREAERLQAFHPSWPEAPRSETAGGPQSAVELTELSRLSDYLVYAAMNNPGLQAAFNHWRATLERIPQTRVLPDPMLKYAYTIRRMDRSKAWNTFALEQMFPWFGKLDLQGTMAEEEALAAAQRYESERLKLFYQVKGAYYEYHYLRRATEITRENVELMGYFEQIIRVRYTVAAATHPDMIRAQVELGKLENDLQSLTDLRGAAASRLNAALNRPPGAPLPWPTSIPEERTDVPDDQVLDWLREASPELKGMAHEIAREAASVELAYKNYYPDFTLGAEFMPQPSKDMRDSVSVMVGLTLPIWRDKYDAGVREAKARQAAARQTKADRENMLLADAKLALFNFRDAGRKVSLYRDGLIPKAKESLKAIEASFRVGSSGFLDLLDAQRVLLEFQLSYERGLADQAVRLAEVEMLVGRDIPRQATAPRTEPASSPAPMTTP